MKRFNRILVPLDYSKMDDKVLKYLAVMMDCFRPNSIHFLHVESNLANAQILKPQFMDDLHSPESQDVLIREKMKKAVSKYFGEMSGLNISFDVVEGSPFEQILHWADIKNADLLVLGKRNIGSGSGMISRKIARNSACSILFISENAKTKPENLILPIDFSDHSKVVLSTALELAEKLPDASLNAVHVYEIPTAYFKILRTYGQFQDVMEQNAKDAYKFFVKKIDLKGKKLNVDFIPDETSEIGKELSRYANKSKNNLIIVGAKGHSNFELLLMGSVTEKILLYHDQSPILVVKNRKAK